MEKKRLAIIFGGKSPEHPISIRSARSVVKNIDKKKYQICLIKIDQKGDWYLIDNVDLEQNEGAPQVAMISVREVPQIIDINSGTPLGVIDVVFPVLHGAYGEDGTIQGLFKMLNVAFVGTGLLGSTNCMDKDYCKRLLANDGLMVAPGYCYTKETYAQIDFDKLVNELQLPLFIKPANAGSSVGVHKINSESEFRKGMEDAFLYDHKVLVEKTIVGREIECAVLGNENAQSSVPGEIIPQTEFYSYESKYESEDGAILEAPAKLESEEQTMLQDLAIRAYNVLNCEGLSRVDFFLTEDGTAYINEINTMPGFTTISMYPKLWELSGISYSNLIDQLIDLGLDRKKKECLLHTNC